MNTLGDPGEGPGWTSTHLYRRIHQGAVRRREKCMARMTLSGPDSGPRVPSGSSLADSAELGEQQKEQFSIRLCLGLFASRSIWSDETLEERFLPTVYGDHFFIERHSGKRSYLLLWKCVKAQTWGHCYSALIMKTRGCVCRTSEKPTEASGLQWEKK